MSPRRIRIAAWAAPIVCFTLTGAVIVDRHGAFTASVRRNRQLESDLSQAYTAEEAADHVKKATRFACATRNPREESVFFAGLRRRAAVANVTIVRLRSQSETLGDEKAAGGPPAAGEASTENVTKGVTRIGCQLVLDGSYPALRRFVHGLWEADRLYTMNDVTWGRSDEGTQLSLTLNRYLAPQTPLKEGPNP